MKKIIYPLIILTIGLTASPSFASNKTKTEEVGDIVQLLLPAIALGYSTSINDTEGTIQFLKGFASAGVTTGILKNTVGASRPNRSPDTEGKSFPSGHTTAAFSGASFLYTRYGPEVGIPAYAAAAFVGYSRIYGKKHYFRDVTAGALIAIGWNSAFTTPYLKTETYALSFTPQPDGGKINLHMIF